MNAPSSQILIRYGYDTGGPMQRELELVFTNRTGLSLPEIKERFAARMINTSYFVPSRLGLDELVPHACDALGNHDWHELIAIETTGLPASGGRDIQEVLTP